MPALAWSLSVLSGLVMCALPLVSILGYESAVATGVIAGIGAMMLTLGAVRSGRIPPPLAPQRHRSPAADFLGMLPAAVGLTLPPLALLALNGLRVQRCDPWGGAALWIPLPFASAVLGALFGWVAGALLPRSRWAWALASGMVALDFGWLLYRLAFQPPLVGYPLLLGYFAGSIYDEAFRLPNAVWWSRAQQLGEAGLVLLALEGIWRRRAWRSLRPILIGLLVLAIPVAALRLKGHAHNVDLDREAIAERLGGVVETEHFRIHLDPSDYSEAQLAQLTMDHELRYAEMQAFWQEDPVAWRGRPIDSFVYPDAKAHFALMGSQGTLIARPWTHEMHIRWSGWGTNSLAHELAHLFTAPFGGGPLQIATQGGLLPHVGLIEGAALAAEWPPSELTPHEAVAAMRQLGIAPKLRNLFDPAGFWKQPGGKAYTSMGSFVRWLIDTAGIDAFKAAYGEGDWEGAYGRPLSQLIREWQDFIDTVPLDDRRLALAAWRYRHGSIFDRTCARTLGELERQEAGAKGRGDLERALALRREIIGFEPEPPEHRIKEAQLLSQLDRMEEAQATLRAVLEIEGLGAAERADAMELLGDLHWRAGEAEEAAATYDECATLGVSDGNLRTLAAKAHGALDPDPEASLLARRYILDRGLSLYLATQWADRSPDDPLPRYLAGLQLTNADAFADAIPWLEGPTGRLAPEVLDDRRRLLLAWSLLMVGRTDEANALYAELATSRSSRTRAEAAVGSQRADWLQAHPQPPIE